jgi:hypothetical protein
MTTTDTHGRRRLPNAPPATLHPNAIGWLRKSGGKLKLADLEKRIRASRIDGSGPHGRLLVARDQLRKLIDSARGGGLPDVLADRADRNVAAAPTAPALFPMYTARRTHRRVRRTLTSAAVDDRGPRCEPGNSPNRA